ncbi:MAG: flotillin family protein [Planctomycetota bacterium]
MIGLYIAGALLLAFLSTGIYIASRYEKVGPNEVLIVSGRRGRYECGETGQTVEKNFRVYHGGGTFVMPIRERVDRMSVELMTLEIETPPFFTKFGMPIEVDGIAQIKVMSDDPISIVTAAEMFLSKTAEEMNQIAHQMMQGHLRAVISTLPFEEIHANPEAFAQTVQRLTAEDLANMGIQVVSFTIREVKDPSGYMQALGRPQLAEVKKNAVLGEAAANRDATLGKATAERDAVIAAARSNEEAQLAKISADLAVANAESKKSVELMELEARLSRTKAAADMAYELEQTKVNQQLMDEQLGVSKIQRERQVELEDLEIARREKELEHSVRKPAEAERFRLETLVQAEQCRLRALAEAEAQAARARGLAEAEVVRARGEAEAEAVRLRGLAEAEGLKARYLAEAEGMQKKAEAWRGYNAAAIGQLTIEKLPEIAKAVAAPLQQVEKIVLVNTGNGAGGTGVERVTQSVTDVIAQVPAVVEAMTGVDLKRLLAGLPGVARQLPAPEPELALSGAPDAAD